MRVHTTSDPPTWHWEFYTPGKTAGYVIVQRCLGEWEPGKPWPGAYWCGHLSPDRFCRRLESRSRGATTLVAAELIVYDKVWDASLAWRHNLARYHPTGLEPPLAVVAEYTPLSSIEDRTLPPPVRLNLAPTALHSCGR